MSLREKAHDDLFTFALTNGDGEFVYGHCARFSHAGKLHTLCIMTPHPWFLTFHKILIAAQREYCATGTLHCATSLYNCALPAPGGLVDIHGLPAEVRDRFTRLARPPETFRYTQVDVQQLFNAFDVQGALTLFACALEERRILFVGPDLGKLSACVYGLSAMMCPFEWKGVFIPILPSGMEDVLCAPMPFVIGLPLANLPNTQKLPTEQIVVCDIKHGRFSGAQDVMQLPALRSLTSNITKCLAQSSNEFHHQADITTAVLRCCLEYLTALFAKYKHFVTQDSPPQFDEAAFLQHAKSKGNTVHTMIKMVLQTQYFSFFKQQMLECEEELNSVFRQLCAKKHPELYNKEGEKASKGKQWASRMVGGGWTKSLKPAKLMTAITPLLNTREERTSVDKSPSRSPVASSVAPPQVSGKLQQPARVPPPPQMQKSSVRRVASEDINTIGRSSSGGQISAAQPTHTRTHSHSGTSSRSTAEATPTNTNSNASGAVPEAKGENEPVNTPEVKANQEAKPEKKIVVVTPPLTSVPATAELGRMSPTPGGGLGPATDSEVDLFKFDIADKEEDEDAVLHKCPTHHELGCVQDVLDLLKSPDEGAAPVVSPPVPAPAPSTFDGLDFFVHTPSVDLAANSSNTPQKTRTPKPVCDADIWADVFSSPIPPSPSAEAVPRLTAVTASLGTKGKALSSPQNTTSPSSSSPSQPYQPQLTSTPSPSRPNASAATANAAPSASGSGFGEVDLFLFPDASPLFSANATNPITKAGPAVGSGGGSSAVAKPAGNTTGTGSGRGATGAPQGGAGRGKSVTDAANFSIDMFLSSMKPAPFSKR